MLNDFQNCEMESTGICTQKLSSIGNINGLPYDLRHTESFLIIFFSGEIYILGCNNLFIPPFSQQSYCHIQFIIIITDIKEF